MTDTTPAWVDTHQAAARLSLHPDTLRRLRRVGGGPPYSRIGRAIRYRVADLDRWMLEHAASSTSDESARSAA